MTDRVKYLRIALVAVGLIFVFGIYPLTIVCRPVGRGTLDSQNICR